MNKETLKTLREDFSIHTRGFEKMIAEAVLSDDTIARNMTQSEMLFDTHENGPEHTVCEPFVIYNDYVSIPVMRGRNYNHAIERVLKRFDSVFSQGVYHLGRIGFELSYDVRKAIKLYERNKVVRVNFIDGEEENKVQVILKSGTTITIETCYESFMQYGGTTDELYITLPIAEKCLSWLQGDDEFPALSDLELVSIANKEYLKRLLGT